MSSVRTILSTMKPLKSLWFKILNTVAYLKNCSPGSDGITPFEKLQGDKPDLRHLRIVGLRAWVHIPKTKRRKLDERSWQGIFVGYEGQNQYRICNPRTGTVHVYRNVKIDEKNLYDKSSVSPWELADDDCSPSDDLLFADPNKFDADTNKFFQRNTPGPVFLSKKTASLGNQDLVRDNQKQSAREEENNEPTQQNLLEDHEDDNDSALNSVPDSIGSPPRRSTRVPVPRESFSSQIAYGSGPLPEADSQDNEGLSGHDQKSANYVSTRAAKSHQYMVRVLCILSSNMDNKSLDQPVSLKEAMARMEKSHRD